MEKSEQKHHAEQLQAIVQVQTAELKQCDKELSALKAIATSVSQSLGIEEALNDSLDKVLDIVGAKAGAIYLLEGDELVLSLQRGMPQEQVERFQRVPRGTTFPFFTVPLVAKGRVQGLLGLVMVGKPQLKDQDVEFLTVIGNQLGVAIENARLYESIKTKEHQVKQLLPRVIASQEEERRRLSLDIHDSVAQWMFAAMARVTACDDLLSRSRPSEAQTELAYIRQTLEQSVEELRRVAADLHPPALDKQELVQALRQYVNDFGKKEGLACSFQVKGVPIPLPLSVEIALYRVVQEALANIVKHAAASRVTVQLQFLEETISTEICDNGKGFDFSPGLDDGALAGHLGLQSMKERAEILGGSLRIKTGPGAGTRIRLIIPILTRV